MESPASLLDRDLARKPIRWALACAHFVVSPLYPVSSPEFWGAAAKRIAFSSSSSIKRWFHQPKIYSLLIHVLSGLVELICLAASAVCGSPRSFS